jgi:hypothetical protein
VAIFSDIANLFSIPDTFIPRSTSDDVEMHLMFALHDESFSDVQFRRGYCGKDDKPRMDIAEFQIQLR